ncbi:unnamed protein product [Adineta steineri]|uniref:EGF-like domain-containing protein n=1 Tax=Adineta steineri TaxID=433720 RepID=A0A814U5B8_9BILA|nr:unnamed protein product [Adineta steineri]CAF1287246.1 unnamed protein product [Adineta steineri]
MGTNIGIQIRKLYEPQLYPNASVVPLFKRIFGKHTKEVCSVGFEANPIHSNYLKEFEKYCLKRKYRVKIYTSTAVINRFQCLEKWQRFGGSCYYPSNITSTATEANNTCNMAYSNNSQLMQIRHSIELYYAAHFLITNNLSELLIDISSHVLNVLDFCFNNNICGKHGRCINGLVGVKCSCYFWSDGLLCREISMKFIQIAIGLFIMLLLIVLTKQPIQQYQQRIMKKLFDPCKASSTVSDSIRDVTSKFMTDERSEDTSALERQCSDVRTGQPGDYLSPIEPFETTNRYETAALCGVIMVEMLMTLERFFIDLSELWNYGVLRLLFERSLLPFLYSIRYYPIFASLQQKNICVRFFAFLYMMGIIGYTIIRRSSCMDYLPLSKRFSIYDEVKHRMELGTWITIYGVLKNMPQFYLLSYISAELTVRFIYDSIYLNYMKKPSVKEPPMTPGIEFNIHKSTGVPPNFPNHDSGSSTYWSHIRKVVSKMYQWNPDFQFTTIATFAYTLAFVLIFYLTCVFTFQSIMGTSSMHFLIFCLKQIVDIGFHIAIISSAVRLIKGLAFNILLMPRIDCSYLGRTCEKYDAEFMAYISYLHMETTYRPQSKSSAQEENILVSYNDPNRSETEKSKQTFRLEYLSREDSDEEESSDQLASEAQHDMQSDTSSISLKYLRNEYLDTLEDSTLHMSNHVQQVLSDTQQLSTKSATKK